jgi:polyphosphate glucokinase
MNSARKVLAIDIGGTSVKFLASGRDERVKMPSGKRLTPGAMVAGVRELAQDWEYDVVSIGYPGPVRDGRLVRDPHNLAPGWVDFDFENAFARPVKLINDAAMQALGSYRGGTMLFLGLGTGLGSALVVDGVVVPMELGHLSYGKRTYEDYLGLRGLERLGKKKWQKLVHEVTARFAAAMNLDDVVLGGGNAKKLERVPEGCRLGDNSFAFVGGFRMWEDIQK